MKDADEAVSPGRAPAPGGGVTRLRRGAIRLFQHIMLRTAIAVAESRCVAGFQVFFGPDQAYRDAMLVKIQGALATIAEHDPRRFARMRRDLGRLMLVGKGLHVDSALRLGTLDTRWLGKYSVQEVAVSLIEMAVRARIGRKGGAWTVGGWSSERIWRRAAIEQLAFLSRLPDRTAAVAQLEAHVRKKLDTFGR